MTRATLSPWCLALLCAAASSYEFTAGGRDGRFSAWYGLFMAIFFAIDGTLRILVPDEPACE